MTLKKKQNSGILSFPTKKEMAEVKGLTYVLLRVIALHEHKSPEEILKSIYSKKKPDVDPTSAVLIFIISYLSHFQNDRLAAKN